MLTPPPLCFEDVHSAQSHGLVSVCVTCQSGAIIAQRWPVSARVSVWDSVLCGMAGIRQGLGDGAVLRNVGVFYVSTIRCH